jgi:ubiquinone/menaquinone biosynthesis C-methylase UbiE
MLDSIDRFNSRFWKLPCTVSCYSSRDTLFAGETALLEKLRPEITNKKLLDIGVGGGRTTRFLLAISRDYTAIDYSPPLVEAVRLKFNVDSIYCCDAREMRRFRDGTFDFALFSYNGLDYVSHTDRLTILREVWRVLQPGGIFVFSTHNRDFVNAGRLPWRRTDLKLTRSFLHECASAMVLLPRHLRMKRHEIHENEYAILNDSAGDYSLLTYYISIDAQIRQAEQIGFNAVEVYDMNGRPVSANQSSPWIYFIVRKKIPTR